MKKDRRIKVLINPAFQIKFVGFFITFFVLNFLVIVGAIRYSFFKFGDIGMSLNLPQDHAFFELLRNQESQILILILLSTIIAIIIAFIGGVYLSHKVAGPIKNICSQFEKAREQSTRPQINIRKDDFFQELPEQINLYFSNEQTTKTKKVG